MTDRAAYWRAYNARRRAEDAAYVERRRAEARRWYHANKARRVSTDTAWRARNRDAIKVSRCLGVTVPEARAMLESADAR